jgi:hypothetical protein
MDWGPEVDKQRFLGDPGTADPGRKDGKIGEADSAKSTDGI